MVRDGCKGTAGYKEEAHKTIGSTMQATEVQRLDVVQCATEWKSRARLECVEYDVVIDGYLAEFHAEESGTQQLS